MDLLKTNSKPISTKRKRKTVPIKGTFADYQDSKKKPQPGPGMAQPPSTQHLAHGAQQLLNFGAASQTQKGPSQPKDAKMNK